MARPGSVPLAWRNLVSNKSRLLRSAGGIGFAVLLMLMQLGFEQAFFESAFAVIRALDGDILLQSVHKYQFATRDPFPRADLDKARDVPGVASARALYADWFNFFWKNPIDGKVFLVRAFGFDPEKSLATFNACPLFTALGDSVVTGPTGQNLRDVRLLMAEQG